GAVLLAILDLLLLPSPRSVLLPQHLVRQLLCQVLEERLRHLSGFTGQSGLGVGLQAVLQVFTEAAKDKLRDLVVLISRIVTGELEDQSVSVLKRCGSQCPDELRFEYGVPE